MSVTDKLRKELKIRVQPEYRFRLAQIPDCYIFGPAESQRSAQQLPAQTLSPHQSPLGNFANQQWDIYSTYPRIVVVEHYTFLSPQWEFRICFHVMIPPDDWSMMLLRTRGEWDPILAARREWNETTQTYEIHEIPVEDYPIIDGY